MQVKTKDKGVDENFYFFTSVFSGWFTLKKIWLYLNYGGGSVCCVMVSKSERKRLKSDIYCEIQLKYTSRKWEKFRCDPPGVIRSETNPPEIRHKKTKTKLKSLHSGSPNTKEMLLLLPVPTGGHKNEEQKLFIVTFQHFHVTYFNIVFNFLII